MATLTFKSYHYTLITVPKYKTWSHPAHKRTYTLLRVDSINLKWTIVTYRWQTMSRVPLETYHTNAISQQILTDATRCGLFWHANTAWFCLFFHSQLTHHRSLFYVQITEFHVILMMQSIIFLDKYAKNSAIFKIRDFYSTY